MPEISRFFGIIISTYYNDHAPSHFHVNYNKYRAKISISDLKLLDGDLPRRALSLVLEWAFEHRAELLADWALAQERKPLKPIRPLE